MEKDLSSRFFVWSGVCRSRGVVGAAQAEGPVGRLRGQTDIRGLPPQDPGFVAARCL